MSWFDGLRSRIVASFRGATEDRNLQEEIAFHLDLETARQRASGHATPEAQAAAIARFGNRQTVIDRTREARGPMLLQATMQDLRSAWRALRKRPGFAALSIATLAVGIGTTIVAFTVLDHVLLRTLPYRDAGRLVILQDRDEKGALLTASFPNFVDWRARSRSLSGVASQEAPGATVVQAGTEKIRVSSKGVSRNFFAILGVPLYRGREFSAEESAAAAPASLIVTYEFWQREMGGREPLGTIRFEGRATPVIGVTPPGFEFFGAADIFWAHERWPGTCRTCGNYRVFGRLARSATIQGAQAEMTSIAATLKATYQNDDRDADIRVLPMQDVIVGGYRQLLNVVFGAAALVLLIACTNLVSAQLARGLSRTREVAVRTALGASRVRLFRQLLFESSLLAVTGAVLGVILGTATVRAVRVAATGLIPRLAELRVDGIVLIFVVCVTLFTALVIGVFPAIKLARRDPAQLLGSARGSAQVVRGTSWRILVAVEVALAVVLLVGASLLVQTFRNIVTADTGLQSRGVITVSLSLEDSIAQPRLEEIRSALAALPGVQGAAWVNVLPLAWGNSSAPVRRTTDPIDHDWPAFAGFRLVSADYFRVVGQQVLRGRGLTQADGPGAAGVAVITPGIAATLWPGQDPIGKQISTNYLFKQWLTVVGVVAEASNWSSPRGQQNEIYTAMVQHPNAGEGSLAAVVRVKGSTAAAIPALRARLHQLLPEAPARFDTIDDRIARTAADRRFAMITLTLFAAIALFLASLGVYGTMSYLVTSRTRELGVRLALGASPSRLLWRVLRDAATMVGSGVIVGLCCGALLTRLLNGTLYGVGASDPLAYVSGAIVLLVTGIAGALLPAWRSSRIDPLVAIAAE